MAGRFVFYIVVWMMEMSMCRSTARASAVKETVFFYMSWELMDGWGRRAASQFE